MSKRDYYDILGLAKNTSEDEIKQAYRKLASKFHPDKITGADNSPEKLQAEASFKEAKEAYEILSDSEKRAQYDAYGHNGPQPQHRTHQWTHAAGGSDEFNTIFKTFFSQNGRFAENLFGQKPQAETYSVNISLADAYIGRQIQIDASHALNLPPGIRSGSRFYVANKFYRIDIQPHYKFKRSNDDLLVEITIDAVEAMLGVSAVLEHLDSVKLQFSIPAGIQQGQIVKLTGKGMKNPETDRTGDLLVRISISILQNITEVDKIALRSLAHRDSITI